MEETKTLTKEDKVAQKNIEERVRKLERSNYISKKLNPDEVVKRIRKIVEEEVK